jgi:excisionase family DNA binding protein
MAAPTVRMDTQSRKQQIVKAALETIGRYGIQGATISRIAQGAGITPAALYSHFENRRAILVAALDEVYEQITDSFRASWSDDPIEIFRQICERHTQKVMSQDKTSHAHLFLEFVASAPEEGLREVLREKEQENQHYLMSVVDDFKERGRLSQEVDAELVAWLVACWAWAGDVANLMDAAAVWQAKVSARLMQSILRSLTPSGADAPPPVCPQEPAADQQDASRVTVVAPIDDDGLPDGAVFTVQEAAEILKVSAGVIQQMLEDRQLVCLTLGDEKRIPRRALVALLRGNGDDSEL